jgi:hypothetical protein
MAVWFVAGSLFALFLLVVAGPVIALVCVFVFARPMVTSSLSSWGTPWFCLVLDPKPTKLFLFWLACWSLFALLGVGHLVAPLLSFVLAIWRPLA